MQAIAAPLFTHKWRRIQIHLKMKARECCGQKAAPSLVRHLNRLEIKRLESGAFRHPYCVSKHMVSLKEERLASSRQRIMREILHYMIEHPDAMDTVHGILSWWMPKGYRERGGKELQEALDALVLQGWLSQKAYQNGRTLYGVNKRRYQQIKEFLRGL